MLNATPSLFEIQPLIAAAVVVAAVVIVAAARNQYDDYKNPYPFRAVVITK